MDDSRRSFLRNAGLTAVATAQATVARAQAAPPGQDLPAAYIFFNEQEAAFVEAATARLIPSDETGPGAREAGVPQYIDRQLAGAWGAGDRLYRSGPWHAGEPTQGYQLPHTPAELFRKALRGIADDVRKQYGAEFGALPEARQDAYLTALQKENRDLGGVPSGVFFTTLLEATLEGFFSDPAYGGNRDMVSWKMIGFPGAYANYYDLVDRHGVAFDQPPVGLADDGHGRMRLRAVPMAPGGDAGAHGAHAGPAGVHDRPAGGK